MLQILTWSTYSVLTPHMCTVASTPPAVNTYLPSWLATRLTTYNRRKNVSHTCLNIGGHFDETLIHCSLAIPYRRVSARKTNSSALVMESCLYCINPTIWWHRFGSTLAQVMACCLMAPSHYLNQYWLINSKVQWQSSEGNFKWNTSANQ